MSRGVDCERNWRIVHHAHVQARLVRAEQGNRKAVGHVIQIEDTTFTVDTEGGEIAFRYDEASVTYAAEKSEAQA